MNVSSVYYHAHIKKENIIFFVSLFRSIEDNVAFDRIEEPKNNIFEFFVPEGCEQRFLEIMKNLSENKYVEWIAKKDIQISGIYKIEKY